jgi:hypothetical protein
MLDYTHMVDFRMEVYININIFQTSSDKHLIIVL